LREKKLKKAIIWYVKAYPFVTSEEEENYQHDIDELYKLHEKEKEIERLKVKRLTQKKTRKSNYPLPYEL
jgi:hypothetical protein